MAGSEVADRRVLVYVALGLAALVLVALAHATHRFSRVRALARAPAVVVEIEARTGTGAKSSTQHVPVAEVALPDGEKVRAPLEASSNSPFCCDVGEALDVLYDPRDLRGTILADRFADLYGPQLAFSVVGGLFLLVLVRALRGDRQASPAQGGRGGPVTPEPR